MADHIRYSIDVAAKPAEVYAFIEDPKIGQLFAPTRDVIDVAQNGGGRVKACQTKRGKVEFTLHSFPQRFEAEYYWPGYRARYALRFEPIGEAVTRVSIDINLQPQSFMGRVKASLTRLGVKSHINDRVTAIRRQFR